MIHFLPDWAAVAVEALSLIGGLLGAIAACVIWVARHTFVSKADLNVRMATVDKRLAAGDSRFAVIETEMKHLPTADDMKELTNRVGGLEQTVTGFGARLDGLREVLERVERPLNVLVDHQLKKAD